MAMKVSREEFIGIPTNEERRKVARCLRGDPMDTMIPHRKGRNHGMGLHEAADRFWDLCDRIKKAGEYDIAFSSASVLAYLIEPEPERTCKDVEGGNLFRCSKCGCELMRIADGWKPLYMGDVNYCPNCGARVVENA